MMRVRRQLPAILFSACLPLLGAQAQQGSGDNAKTGAAASYSGCVTQVPHVSDAYVLATADRCLLLGGTGFEAAKVLGRDVVLRGTIAEATGRLPPTLQVESTRSVKGACARTCTLPPPGTRGLHGNEKPGHEGGTPGEQPKTAPPQ